MTPRSTIWKALFAKLRDVPGVMTSSRRLRMWSDVAGADQPALFLSQKQETAKAQPRLPTIWTLHGDITLYGLAGDPGDADSSPMDALNPIIDAVVEVLLPKGGTEEQNLGGLVERCRIDGEVVVAEGVDGNQSIVIIPILIVVPQ